jgi:hypothetical protein
MREDHRLACWANDRLTTAAGSGEVSGRRLDQPGQRRAHCVVEIGIGEAALHLQPRNNPLNEDAALLKRHAVSGGPDGPKLRIAEDDHVTMVLPTR